MTLFAICYHDLAIIKAVKAQTWSCYTVYFQVTTYKTIPALSRETHRAAEGTLAYVSEKGGELYIRARNGWRKIQVYIVCVDTCMFG